MLSEITWHGVREYQPASLQDAGLKLQWGRGSPCTLLYAYADVKGCTYHRLCFWPAPLVRDAVLVLAGVAEQSSLACILMILLLVPYMDILLCWATDSCMLPCALLACTTCNPLLVDCNIGLRYAVASLLLACR